MRWASYKLHTDSDAESHVELSSFKSFHDVHFKALQHTDFRSHCTCQFTDRLKGNEECGVCVS